MPDIIVRPATLADVAAITAIHCSTVTTWRDPHTRQSVPYADLDLFGRWYNGGPWMSFESCADHLSHLLRCGHVALVSDVAGTLAGEAEFYISREPAPYGPALHLSILYVHQQWQRQGVGRALLDAGIAFAMSDGLSALTTQPEKEALPFYQQAHFAPWLQMQEMQLDSLEDFSQDVPPALQPMLPTLEPPSNLALRVGRYQSSPTDWDTLTPSLELPGWSDLRRRVWRGKLAGVPVVLALREQLNDPHQADGYAWLPVDAPLAPVLTALRALSAKEGFKAVDVLLPESAVPELRQTFALGFQTTVSLWRHKLDRK